MTSWQYDEFQQVGRDYGNPTEVEIYDSTHADFRDVEAESKELLDLLGLASSDVLIDFGSGTGTFAIAAARRCARLHAVDVSQAMIDYAKAKANTAGISNLVFSHAGFLTYEHLDEPAAAIAMTFALHHLPDLWKGIALARMRTVLKPDGQLYIHDVILEQDNATEVIKAFINKQSVAGGDFLKRDAEGHFQQEHSTYDWILDELLARAGFRIVSKTIYEGVIGKYHCLRDASAISELFSD
jgi:ubiquinone/menaquinone biosynthesis C-methylase UbiE